MEILLNLETSSGLNNINSDIFEITTLMFPHFILPHDPVNNSFPKILHKENHLHASGKDLEASYLHTT